VVGEDSVTVGEDGLLQERPEPVHTGTVVHEYDGFSGSPYLILEFDAIEGRPIHLLDDRVSLTIGLSERVRRYSPDPLGLKRG
jgi:hypothetical protein